MKKERERENIFQNGGISWQIVEPCQRLPDIPYTPDRSSKFPAILTRAKRAGREAGALQVHWFAYHRNFTARYLREITRGTVASPTSYPASALNKPRNWFTFELDATPCRLAVASFPPSKGRRATKGGRRRIPRASVPGISLLNCLSYAHHPDPFRRVVPGGWILYSLFFLFFFPFLSFY